MARPTRLKRAEAPHDRAPASFFARPVHMEPLHSAASMRSCHLATLPGSGRAVMPLGPACVAVRVDHGAFCRGGVVARLDA